MKSIRVWRFSHRDYAGDSFSGEGARIYGGRFNSEGLPVVYTAESLSLALLELLVRVRDREYMSLCNLYHADVPVELIIEVSEDQLPAGWDSLPYGSSSQRFGDEWLVQQKSAALRLPSVVVPIEHNVIINPLHPDFRNISYTEVEEFSFDRRLMGDLTEF